MPNSTNDQTPSCLCDAVYRTSHEVCEPGLKNLCCAVGSDREPQFRYEGEIVSEQEALTIATRILSNANYPLLAGIEQLGISSQQKAIDMIRYLGGAIDPGVVHSSLPRVGAVTATIGEIQQRSDCIVLLNCKLWDLKPRLFKSLVQPGNCKLVWIGNSPCPIANCDESIVVSSICMEEMMLVALADSTNSKIQPAKLAPANFDSTFAGKTFRENVRNLVDELTARNYVSVFYQRSSESEFEVLSDLVVTFVKKLNAKTRAVAMEIPGAKIESSASHVLSWATGFGNPVDVSSDTPRSFDCEYAAPTLLRRRECDAVLAFGSLDQIRHDDKAVQHLNSVPKILFSWGGDTVSTAMKECLEIQDLCLSGDSYTRFDDLTFKIKASEKSLKLSLFLTQLFKNLRTLAAGKT